MLLLIAVFALTFTACDNGVGTLESLLNEYGIVIEGGGFEEGSTLVSNEIATGAEEGAEVLAAIADQNYDKDGSIYIFDIYVTKDGAKVQPSGKVKVSVPLPNIQVDNYLVFHVKADNTVENLVPTVTDGKISFETSSFSYFIIAEAAPDEHVHDYVWVEGTEPTCKEEGVVAHYHCDGCGKNFDENYGEIDSVVAEKGSHDVAGNYSPRVEPTFFTEGTVAYYTCNDCLKYIDEDGQIIPAEDITIPAWTQDVTIYVNDVATKLVPILIDNGSTAEWELKGLSVEAGDVITIRLTEDSSICLTFRCDGNIIDTFLSTDKVVMNTDCDGVNVNFAADHSGMYLFLIDPTICAHNYEWVEGTEPTCEKEGVVGHYHCDGCGKNFDPNYGEIDTVSIPKAEHEYGSMYWGKSANFWEDGNIEYYQCAVCEKYFDAEYNEVETVVIPKYSTNISICVNGTPTALVLGEQHENFIEWSLEGLSVTKGDVITLCQTDNAEIVHNYFAEGNVDKDGKILTTAAAANVVLTATPNGLMLFIDGYKYEGIVIEINGVQYPMNFVTYPSGEETSYVYGYVEFAVADEFVIIDNVSGTVYDYDDLSEEFLWNTWDYHRGDNDEFVIDYAARYGIEFDNNGNKQIYIAKAFAPYDGESFGVVFDGSDREDEMLSSTELPTDNGADNEFMWTLTHCTTMNNADFVEYIGENGLWFYHTTISIEAGEKFSLKNITTGELIGADYLVDITGDITAVTREGDLVSVTKSGSFYIIYLPAFNSFTIECDTSDPLETIYLYVGNDTITLTPDENGDVKYDGFEATSSTYIMFMDGRYDYLTMVLDETMDVTLANIVTNSGVYVLYPTKPGVYNLRYNVNTTAVYLEFVRDIEGGEEEDTITYFYWLGILDSVSGSNQTLMEQDAANENLYVASGITMNANCYLMVGVYDNLGNETICTTLAETDSSIAESDGEKVTVYLAGTYDIYFDTEAKTIKLVAVSGSIEEKSMPKDIYISTMETYTLIENTENADELCYLGLVLESYDYFRIRDTDNNYISDITLASGTTGANTNGSSVMVEADGTYNIYINKTTHEVRIVAVS